MKLNRIAFAKLIGFCAGNGMSTGTYEIEHIDELIDIEVPEASAIYPQAEDVNCLMALMAEGTRKIEAIKMHRKVTGWGLKESKDAVEKHWVPPTAL